MITRPVTFPVTGNVTFAVTDRPAYDGGGESPSFFVRADGTATVAADATSPTAVGTAFNLQTLEVELSAGHILSGSTILFSSQGGDYDSLSAQPLGNRTGDASVAQFYFYEGITFKNAVGEDVVFDNTGITGGPGGLVKAHNIFAGISNVPTNSTIEANTTGSITLIGGGTAECVKIRNGAGGSNYGLKLNSIDIARSHNNISLSGIAADVISMNDAATMEVTGGTHRQYALGMDGGGTSQVYTCHDTSKLKVNDPAVIGCENGAGSVGASSMTLNNVSFTDIWGKGLQILDSGSTGHTLIANNCSLDTGVNGTGLCFSGEDDVAASSYTLNNCTLRHRSTGASTYTTGADAPITFNGGSWLIEGALTGTPQFNPGVVANTHTLTFNDFTFTFTGTLATRFFMRPLATMGLVFNRCTIDSSAATNVKRFLEFNHNGTQKAGSGFFSCVITGQGWDLFLINTIARSVADTGFRFVNCTIVDVGRVWFSGVDTGVGSQMEFLNCHFEDVTRISTLSGTGDSKLDYCSMLTNTDDTSDLTSTNPGPKPASPSFVSKATQDFRIQNNSDIIDKGINPPDSAALTDRAGNAFGSPSTIGAYEDAGIAP